MKVLVKKKRVKKTKRVFPPRFVYLAGPIMGCNFGQANNWRKAVARELKKYNIVGISPLRCEPLHGPTYKAEYADPLFGTARAIAAKNKFDVRACDVTLAILPKPTAGRVQSYGTIIELGWAAENGRQVILCTDDPVVAQHPVIDACANWKLVAGECKGADFKTLDAAVAAAIKICRGVVGGYTGGKNV